MLKAKIITLTILGIGFLAGGYYLVSYSIQTRDMANTIIQAINSGELLQVLDNQIRYIQEQQKSQATSTQ